MPTTPRLDELLAAACSSYGGRVALAGPDATLTFADLSAASDRVAGSLTGAAGRPVLVPVSNRAADIAAMLGVWRAGGAVVPVHRSAPSEVVAGLLQRTGAGHVAGEAPDGWPAAAVGGRVPAEVGADTAYVLFTSGSTGRPKGVVLSHRAFAGKLAAIEQVLPTPPGGTTLLVLQLAFVYAHWATLQTLLAGSRVVLHERFAAERVLAAVREEGVDRLPVVPTMLRMLLPLLEATPPDAAGLVITGGEPLPAGLGRAVRRALPTWGIADVFGTTETSSTDFVVAPQDYDRDAGLLGRPTPGVEVAVVDEHGGPAAGGEVGELRLRTPYLMTGYLDDRPATEAVMIDGWLRTGDLARRRPDGRIELAGRAGSLISRGGVKVSPLEVEGAYAEHPDVAAALCTGASDPVLGQRIHLLAVLRPGADATAEELRAWGRARMGPFAAPDVVHLVAELPLGATGKTDRRAAAAWVAER